MNTLSAFGFVLIIGGLFAGAVMLDRIINFKAPGPTAVVSVLTFAGLLSGIVMISIGVWP